jgi:hypothetical protein
MSQVPEKLTAGLEGAKLRAVMAMRPEKIIGDL